MAHPTESWRRAEGRAGPRRALLIAALCGLLSASGCGWLWPEDGLYDPARCAEPCGPGSRCVAGQCEALADLGAAPDAGDGGADLPPDANGDLLQPDQPGCGNGKIEGTEECEEGKLDGKSCPSLGFGQGTLTCGDGCLFNTHGCFSFALSAPVVLSATTTPADQPAVASDGSGFLVVWSSGVTGSRTIVGRLVDQQGATSGAEFAIGSGVGSGSGDRHSPAVAYSPSDQYFLVVWTEEQSGQSRRIHGRYVTRTGTATPERGLPLSAAATGDQTGPAVAAAGSRFLVGWSEVTAMGSTDLKVAVRTQGGGLTGTAATLVVASGDQDELALASNGSVFLAAWHDARPDTSGAAQEQIYASRVRLDGVLLDAGGVNLSNDPLRTFDRPAVVSDGSHFLATWREQSANQGDVNGRALWLDSSTSLSASAGLPSTRLFSKLAVTSRFAAVYEGSRYLVLWVDAKSSASVPLLGGSRLDGKGKVLVEAPMELQDAPTGALMSSPAAATAGGQTLVAWPWNVGGGYHRINYNVMK